jgi:hypothetical protein
VTGRRRLRVERLALLALLLTAGCASDPTQGYAAMSTFPEDVATISVPIFENDTFVQGVEFQVTDALLKEIQARTPYAVVAKDRADTVLLGRITAVDLDRLSKSPVTGLSEEVIRSVTIDFQWKDLRSDRVLVERRAFAGYGLFLPSRPYAESIEVGQYEAVQRLVRDIVAELRSQW